MERTVRVPVAEVLLAGCWVGVDRDGVTGVGLVFEVGGVEVGDVARDVRTPSLVSDSGVSVDVGGVEVGVVDVGVGVEVGVVEVGVEEVEVEEEDVQGANSVEMGTVKTCCSPEMVIGTSTGTVAVLPPTDDSVNTHSVPDCTLRVTTDPCPTDTDWLVDVETPPAACEVLVAKIV